MAITKKSAIDKITIRSPYNFIELRTQTVIVEDDIILARNYIHETLKPGKLDTSDNFIETDISGHSTEVQGVACLLYTSPSPRDDPLSRMPSSA